MKTVIVSCDISDCYNSTELIKVKESEVLQVISCDDFGERRIRTVNLDICQTCYDKILNCSTLESNSLGETRFYTLT